MKVSKIKNRVNEGFFSDLVRGKERLGRFIQENENVEMRNDPKIIEQVALKGFLDFRDRLTTAGINLKNAAAISTPEIQDQLEINLKDYVKTYMISGEQQEVGAEIIKFIEKIPDPSPYNEKTIYQYFIAAAKIRADIVVKADKKLKVTTGGGGLDLLQNKLKNNEEMIIPFSGATVLLRKKASDSNSGIYISDWTKLGTSLPAPPTENINGNTFYQLSDSDDEAEHNEHEKNKSKIYSVYLRLSPKPVSTTISAPPPGRTDLLSDLQANLEDNEEITFDYVFPGAAPGSPKTMVVIRKNKVYVSNYVSTTTSSNLPEKKKVPPHGELYRVQRPENLEKIYDAYINSGSPVPKEYRAKPLE
jgi:hypothetical protein